MNEDEDEPVVDAAISLALITDAGELTHHPIGCEKKGIRHLGLLVHSFGSQKKIVIKTIFLDLALRNPAIFWLPTTHRGDHEPVIPYTDPPAWSKRGNHSLPIYSHELLFASEEASTEYSKDKGSNGKHMVSNGGIKKLEFFGNSMPHLGRHYSRAVVMIWPKAHREDIRTQAKGNKQYEYMEYA
ncbi:hypothetical protein ACHAWO_001578 [Cyclotella atomus]|uniref:Uncharacterized protein n=1 Tax=Cyclotella atomus TaxID=382360 RepID=A0ABD3Q639_9STRA